MRHLDCTTKNGKEKNNVSSSFYAIHHICFILQLDSGLSIIQTIQLTVILKNQSCAKTNHNSHENLLIKMKFFTEV